MLEVDSRSVVLHLSDHFHSESHPCRGTHHRWYLESISFGISDRIAEDLYLQRLKTENECKTSFLRKVIVDDEGRMLKY